jgi:UDP-N-acetylmuramoyl-tripeptide--D-alanyl-D-alanine ligase
MVPVSNKSYAKAVRIIVPPNQIIKPVTNKATKNRSRLLISVYFIISKNTKKSQINDSINRHSPNIYGEIMIENTASFTTTELRAILDKSEFHNLNESKLFTGVSIDTRTVKQGNAFVAMKGEKIDSHTLIDRAFEAGAEVCFVERNSMSEIQIEIGNRPIIVSDDNIEVLGELASFHRMKFNIPIVAITGSNGKTTTKEMIADVLATKYNVLRTYENFNNLLGVPLMLLSMNNSYDLAVLELGTNQSGEIYRLGEIVRPTHALITNIGREHLEFLLDLDGVELEETYIFAHVRSEGFAFVNYDDTRLKLYGHVLQKFMTFGTHENAELRASIILDNDMKPILDFDHDDKKFSVNMQTIGLGSAYNAIGATAVGIHFGVETELVKSALEKFTAPLYHGYGRMAIETHSDIKIINDCYNANPESMIIALSTLSKFPGEGKKVAVLGDMRELGEWSEQEHKDILKLASESADLVYLTGDEFAKAYSEHSQMYPNVQHSSKSEIAQKLKDTLKSGDIVLVKASRGVTLETVISDLKNLI